MLRRAGAQTIPDVRSIVARVSAVTIWERVPRHDCVRSTYYDERGVRKPAMFLSPYQALISALLLLDNVQRFSLGGAAHRTRREGSAAGDRAGKRKTCWTKPLAQAPGLWAFNEPGSLVRAHDWGFRFGGLAPFGTSTGPSSCQRRRRVTPALRTGAPTTQAAQASRPRSGGRFGFARFGRSVGAHDVSGSDWQILARAMQPITTMMPVWQCGHSRNECPVSAS